MTLLAVALLTLPRAVADGQDFDVLKSMSVADFRAAGLDKLSDTQVKVLDAWFQEYQRQHPCPDTAATSAPTVAATPAVSTTTGEYPLTAHIVGKFTGWSGATSFTLDNGEVWQQVDDSSLSTGAIMNPKVTISRGLINSYYLSVEGVKDTVLVKRVKH
jgi:hypothetical protein